MPKPKIRPPRAPKSEPPKVTIANQAIQIKLLTQRCVDLVTSRDQEIRYAIEYRTQRDEAQSQKSALEIAIDAVKMELGAHALDLACLRGYQERVREEDKHRYGDLGIAS